MENLEQLSDKNRNLIQQKNSLEKSKSGFLSLKSLSTNFVIENNQNFHLYHQSYIFDISSFQLFLKQIKVISRTLNKLSIMTISKYASVPRKK